MGNLNGRLGALEAPAERARWRALRREVERIARERGVDPDRLEAAHAELRAERRRIKAGGGRPADYLAYLVGRLGQSTEELAARGITLDAIERGW
jgi:hypothetical protein